MLQRLSLLLTFQLFCCALSGVHALTFPFARHRTLVLFHGYLRNGNETAPYWVDRLPANAEILYVGPNTQFEVINGNASTGGHAIDADYLRSLWGDRLKMVKTYDPEDIFAELGNGGARFVKLHTETNDVVTQKGRFSMFYNLAEGVHLAEAWLKRQHVDPKIASIAFVRPDSLPNSALTLPKLRSNEVCYNLGDGVQPFTLGGQRAFANNPIYNVVEAEPHDNNVHCLADTNVRFNDQFVWTPMWVAMAAFPSLSVSAFYNHLVAQQHSKGVCFQNESLLYSLLHEHAANVHACEMVVATLHRGVSTEPDTGAHIRNVPVTSLEEQKRRLSDYQGLKQ